MLRKPSYLRSERAGRERWLISYTDILTLLLILFVAMAAQSVGQQQAGAVEPKAQPPSATVPPVQTPPPAPVPTAPAAPAPVAPVPTDPAPTPQPAQPPNPSHEALVRAEARLKEHGLDLRLEARGLVISLPQAILFASADDRINRSALPIISEIAAVLRDLDNKVELAGHADSIPIHNQRFKNNWELSAARGLSLLNTLTNDYGIAESRLTVSSHGSYSPKGSNDTPDGRAENRRVEILILDQPQQ
ncbi:MAG TPA: OmpA family protein [Bryobacteraceae bacterium]|nr:OmpA family protein [Bryobacteraceae bacterium]